MSALRKLAASRFLAFLLSFALVAGQAAATTILSSMPYSFSNGTASDATQVNANFQQIINQVNAGAAGSGSNNDITALNALTTPLTPAQGGTTVFLGGTSTGSANAQAVVIASPLTWSPAAGRFIAFTPGFTNTTATTLSVNAGTVTNLQKVGPAGLTALTGGEVVSGQQALVGFDGSSYILYNPANAAIGAATINMVKAFNAAKGASIAAAATTDIWTPADGNLYHITGLGGPITSFGTAPQAGAERTLIFDSTGVVLTYNATSLLLPSLANITTVAGDRAIVRADTTGNMIVVDYVRASGQPVVGLGVAPHFIAEDQKPSGTAGGTSIAGVNTRTLNTVLRNVGGYATLASNQVTLTAGTYYITASAPTLQAGTKVLYLYNITDSANALWGAAGNEGVGANYSGSLSSVSGVVTIASTKTFELRQSIQSALAAQGLGIPLSLGVNEAFAHIEITKVQ